MVKESKKKALLVTSVASMISQFNIENIKLLKSLGYEVEVACNFNNGNTCNINEIIELKNFLDDNGVRFYQIDFCRNALNLIKNFCAYKQLKNISIEKHYDIVHCQSPIGGIISRIVFKKYRSKETKIIYTAHGFHFYKGAPLLNWLIYYPIEKIFSFFTDVLIVMNNEDYILAKNKFKSRNIVYVPGVGVDINKITQIDKNDLSIHNDKNEIASKKDIVLISVGELSKRKNHKTIINALKEIDNISLKYLICGLGDYEKYLIELVKQNNLENKIDFLGYQNEIFKFIKMADIFVFPSLQEGLPVALMQAMAGGLPCIVSNIRGNRDLIIDNKGGYLCEANDVELFRKRIIELANDSEKRKKFGEFNIKYVESFSISKVNEKMLNIYKNV